ncbi:MAG: 2-dehydropantoate 2-reductase [Spirochaetes bacterium GWD1_27_9]|nr:MAG: 2-dehydropantoate 2-reductase [Spirochaetes bacterium GWB1_27_13]OHD24119.1 MAG: 2-dehydropantoate 2-reductase [Spirochaetes bacterium GWC1_27_15]OHD34481.1 MAG: 2-dehydropantoate 2-reductase [Spirochaetes bacterium GWD1_27_9]
MNIAVIGVGGVGGYFGGKLTQLIKNHSDLNIFFIARGNHLKEIKNNGLLLDTDEGQFICKPTLATDKISDLPLLDLCLICVKSYDLENVLTQLKEKVTLNTMILPLLNGVDIYERIRLKIDSGIVFPSCVYVGTHIEKYGKVTQRGGACTIHFGKDPQNDYVNPKIFDLLKESNIKYNWLENPYTEIWSKFIFIASFGLVTASFNKTIGEVLQSEELSSYVKNIMREIVSIANKKQIPLPSTIIEDCYLKGAKFPFETKTSFQRDFEIHEKSDERDLFGGAIIRMGDIFNVSTETTKLIYDSIQKIKKIS